MDRAQGERLYASLCRSCHGKDGRGETEIAAQLSPPAGNFTRCNFKYRSTESGTLPEDSDLLRTVYTGIPGTRMAPFSAVVLLPSLGALVPEVKRRCRRFSEEAAGRSIPWPGRPAVYAGPSLARGRAVYVREGCGACHGEKGRGNGAAAPVLRDAAGRRIRPRDFTRGVFRGGYSRLDIYRAFSTGLDGTPMPAMLETVSRGDRWDLANYLTSVGGEERGGPPSLMEAPQWYRRILVWGIVEH